MSTSCGGKMCPKRLLYKHHPKQHQPTRSVHLARNSFSQKLPSFCLLLRQPQAKHQLFLIFSHIGDCYFPVENVSIFNQKGIGVCEVENKWMSTSCHVGNSVWCLCSAWVRVTCSTPDCSVSQEKQFLCMEISWLSWKLVLGSCLCRREVKDRH